MSYLMAGQISELERLRLQSRVWEPAMGWLWVLAEHVEPIIPMRLRFQFAQSLESRLLKLVSAAAASLLRAR
jgi:hypothetical protein